MISCLCRRISTLTALAFVLAAGVAAAQSGRGTISGLVSDMTALTVPLTPRQLELGGRFEW